MTWEELIASEGAHCDDGVAIFCDKKSAKRFLLLAEGLMFDVVATEVPSTIYKIYNLDVPSKGRGEE